MSSPRKYLELRYAGDKGPSDFRARDIAKALKEFEDLVLETLRQEDDEIDPSEVTIGLVEVHEGSNGLRFISSYMSKALAILTVVGHAIEEKTYDDLSDKQRSSLKKLQKVGQKYNSPAEFRRSVDEGDEVLGIIDLEDEIPGPKTVRGTTTLYGRVERIGGKDPTMHVRTRDNEKVIVRLDQDQARDLGNSLYDMIGLRGEAVWLAETGQIDDFKLHEIVDYTGGSITEAFEALSEVVGDSFDGVDPTEFVRRVRGHGGTDDD